MDELIINKPDTPFDGEVTLSGAKNSALKVLAASVLATEPVTLDNMPLGIADVQVKLRMLAALGADIQIQSGRRLRISWPEGQPATEVPDDCGSIRTTLLLLGPLAARCGRARVPLPGGCNLGARAFDLHIQALTELGIACRVDGGFIVAERRNLRAGQITFPLRTTGGTENALLAAVLAPGRTRILNAHTSPEVDDLINCLNAMGAKVQTLGSGVMEVYGVDRLEGGYHRVMYDRIEAVTYMAMALITRGRLLIRRCPCAELEVPMIYLRESGAAFTPQKDGVLVDGRGLLTPFDFATSTYPGIHSDMQPVFAALATQIDGPSMIADWRHSYRYQYVDELIRLGAKIEVTGNTAVVYGPSCLTGGTVTATDLRGGAALVVAALAAEGQTTIQHANRIMRGYEHLGRKLSALGVRVDHHVEEGVFADVA